MPIIELAALPPTAQLCLKTAYAHGGLIISPYGYIGRNLRSGQPATAFTAQPLAHLMGLQLMRCSPGNDYAVELTDRGIALIDQGHVYYDTDH